MIKLNHILVALSHSDAGEEVFNRALNLAGATQAQLTLLHILSPTEEDSPIMSMYPTVHRHYTHLNAKIAGAARQHYQQQSQAVEQQGIIWLRSLINRAVAAGVEAKSIQVYGDASQTICQIAESIEADLIVLGRGNHISTQKVLLGNVSNYVLHHASTSVLIVHPDLPSHQSQTE